MGKNNIACYELPIPRNAFEEYNFTFGFFNQ